LSELYVERITKPIEEIFSISVDALIDETMIEEIRTKGYSRIPVYYGESKSFILGILIVKTLIGVDIDEPKTLRELSRLDLI
jgi:metal transporter CNNM